ncbi:hypothetical protein BCR43DRAFT_179070 [Syncephalastrum racemosum]|uniref:DNA recombination and repair protein Rad51-like C-terminal domain-containing protein n=1 Tax=Syncephalastrum racemosum TaxID=13706 RepID=A0A1X2HQ14_SYNRA|nr:hypothetical protein BCR43DRAFT_179070 [Syncephalastrum racemosum]
MSSQATNTQDEEDYGPFLIQELEKSGISSTDIKKLQEAGFYTVEAIAYAPKKTLLAVKGISENKADKLLMEGTMAAIHIQNDCLLNAFYVSFEADQHGLHNRDGCA